MMTSEEYRRQKVIERETLGAPIYHGKVPLGFGYHRRHLSQTEPLTAFKKRQEIWGGEESADSEQ